MSRVSEFPYLMTPHKYLSLKTWKSYVDQVDGTAGWTRISFHQFLIDVDTLNFLKLNQFECLISQMKAVALLSGLRSDWNISNQTIWVISSHKKCTKKIAFAYNWSKVRIKWIPTHDDIFTHGYL